MSDTLRKRIIQAWEEQEEKRLELEEGERHFPYRDSRGIWTIGVGHNIEADPVMKPDLNTLMKTGLSEDQIRSILDLDVAKAEKSLFSTYPWAANLDEARREVLVDMTFNMGINKLMQFHNSLMEIQSGEYHAAAARLAQSEWYREVGSRAVHLCQILDTGVA